MFRLTYTLSQSLRDAFVSIDSLRRTILTTPVSPKTELELQFQATIDRTYGSLALAGGPITKHDVAALLSRPPKRMLPLVRDVLSYKKALTYITQTWSANPKAVSVSAVETIATLVYPDAKDIRRDLHSLETTIRRIIEWGDPQHDHPILQAAVTQALLTDAFAGKTDHGQIARLVSYLILTKYGFDLRGMLAPEREWARAADSYKRAFETIERHNEFTAWLLYFTMTVRSGMEELHQSLSKSSSELHVDVSKHFFDLSDRQKTILGLLESPTARITNRDVQKRFKISQITASRDLSKLASLGLLYSHGKGRSVSYTRA
ncbi:hypothetical protein HY031_03390 [Candidatus Gottesmanbacteria bacterium]|nr:hypothetical protein [Candidatus Gottesmanbacteria bacterium]